MLIVFILSCGHGDFHLLILRRQNKFLCICEDNTLSDLTSKICDENTIETDVCMSNAFVTGGSRCFVINVTGGSRSFIINV